MLLPSLRLLVRHQARSVPHQFQRRLAKGTAPSGFTDFLKWTKEQPTKNRPKRPQPRSKNAQGGKPLKKKKAQKVKESQWFDSTFRRIFDAMTREERIRETVLSTVRKKKALTPATSGWLGEDWKTENWGLDSEHPVLNLGSVEQTYHNETPEQNSSLHVQTAIQLRNPVARSWNPKSINYGPASAR